MTEEWAPRMAYPYDVTRNATARFDMRATTVHHPPVAMANAAGGRTAAGKQCMTAQASPEDLELGILEVTLATRKRGELVFEARGILRVRDPL